MTTAPVALHGKKRVKIKEYAHKAAMPMRKESENNNTTIQSFNDGREIKGERSGAQCQGYNGDHDAWCTNNVNSNVRSTKNTNDFSIGIHDLEDPGLILKILYQIVAALCLFMVVWTLLIPGSWMFGRSRIHDVVAGGYLVYLGKRGLVPPEFFTKYRGHTAIHLTHLLPSAAWSALIPLQLHTSVRRQHPRLHRHLGYLFFSSSILVAVGLCIILQRGLLFEWSFTDLPPPRISFQPLVMMDLIYFTGTALYALQLAVSRQFTLHRNWVIRHVASGLFIALQRLLIAILFGPFHPPPVSRSSQRTIFGQAGFLAFLISVLCGEYAIHLLNLKQLHVRNKGLCSHQDETAGVSERDLHEEIQKQTEITIHPLGGKSFKMIVCPNDRISAVKRDIELLTKHPSAMQNLIYRNKRLQDECTLGSYGVERGSVIHQRLKIKGGGTKQGTNKEFKFISSRFSRQLARMPRDHPDVIHNTTSDGNDGNSNSQDVDPVAAAQTLPAIDELFMSVPKRMNKRSWIICLSLASFLPLLQNFRVLLSSKGASIFDMTLEFHRKAQFDVPTHLTYQQKRKTTVAYAVSVTGYKEGSTNLLDRAAVLHQSIKLAMQQSARYDFHIYAFVHPDAEPAADKFKQLGYRVQIRDTPFNLSDVPNPEFVAAQKSGCCGEKEYLKLYSWLLLDYPAVIHLDLDTLVLKPMDDLFDLLSDPGYNRKNFQSSAMWTNMEEYDGGVDFLFTRDYYMVSGSLITSCSKPHDHICMIIHRLSTQLINSGAPSVSSTAPSWCPGRILGSPSRW
jgi:hypothetical protein